MAGSESLARYETRTPISEPTPDGTMSSTEPEPQTVNDSTSDHPAEPSEQPSPDVQQTTAEPNSISTEVP